MKVVQSFVNTVNKQTKKFLNFLLPFCSPLALRKGQLGKCQYVKKPVPLICPNAQYHQ